MLYKYLKVIVLFMFVASCKDKPAVVNMENIETIEVDLDADYLEIEERKYFNDSDLVALETTKSSLFSSIKRMVLLEDKILILDVDCQGVYVFNDKGFFLFKIKNIGKGPGEYIQLDDFAIDKIKNHIILYSSNPKQILRYDMDGSFLKKEKILKKRDVYYNSMAYLDSGSYLFLNNNTIEESVLYEYISSEKKPLLDFTEKDETYVRQGILDSPRITKGENIYITFPYSEVIYEYSSKGLEVKYYVDFGENKMKDNIYKEMKTLGDLMNYSSDEHLGMGICSFRENKDYVMFNTMNFGTVLYSKKTKLSKRIQKINGKYLFNSKYIAHNGDDNKMVSVCSANSFKKQIASFKTDIELWDKVSEEVKNLETHVSELDNPILIVRNFK